jgi:magnesium transporter
METLNGKQAKAVQGPTYLLSELLGTAVKLRGKRIGKLEDLVIIDGDLAAEVTHLYVSRPFGETPLAIPWSKVTAVERKTIAVEVDQPTDYTVDPAHPPLLLKDNIVDKKVLDTEGKEVDVVYDARLAVLNNKMYVTDVDMSPYGLMRRIGLRRVADFVANLGESLKGHAIAWKYVEALPAEIGSFEGNLRLKVLKEKLSEMHPADLADVLGQMEPDQRIAVFKSLDTERASDTLEEADPSVQRAILSALPREKIAELVNEMTPGQAADVLAALPSADARDILTLIHKENRTKIQDIIERHEEKIINYATTRFLKFPPDANVRDTIALYRKMATTSDVVMYIYVLDENDRLLGVLDMRELVKADDDALLKDVMVPIVATLKPTSTLREASAMFTRYGYRALPILDENRKMLGVVPFRDMMSLKHLFLE